MFKILDGKKLAEKIKVNLKEKIKEKPCLAVIQLGKNPASTVYVNLKEKDCKEIGITSKIFRLKENTTQEELLKLVNDINVTDSIHGLIVQLPLPKNIDENKVIEAINPKKDVDGFHKSNMGNLLIGKKGFIPSTPKGIMRLLEEYKIDLEGKHAVVIGRSNIVGKPIALLLLQKNATVTIAHSRTKNLKEITKQADILVVAVGKPKLITKDMVKKEAIIIDVGINRINNKLVGDVDFENVKELCSYITPVPGGIGPMTRAMLLENTVEASQNL